MNHYLITVALRYPRMRSTLVTYKCKAMDETEAFAALINHAIPQWEGYSVSSLRCVALNLITGIVGFDCVAVKPLTGAEVLMLEEYVPSLENNRGLKIQKLAMDIRSFDD